MVLALAPASPGPAGVRDGSPVPPAPFSPLQIATARCKACELCVAACPRAVLALDLDTINELGYHPIRLMDAARCTSCALCARVCPDVVFTVWAPPREAR